MNRTRGSRVRFLLSFDLDGTLEIGDPPGPVRLAVVRTAKASGHVIGSASDRTLSEQTTLWEQAQVKVNFVSRKHELGELRERFDCMRFIHIGDSWHDRQCARDAGFEFFSADAISSGHPPWDVASDRLGSS